MGIIQKRSGTLSGTANAASWETPEWGMCTGMWTQSWENRNIDHLVQK